MDSIFNTCVDLLYYLSATFNCTYETINVIIFCIIWPSLTIQLFIKAYVKKTYTKA